MTIAYDRTGKVIGQVVPNVPDYLTGSRIRLLTKKGIKDVPRETVRLVWVSDR